MANEMFKIGAEARERIGRVVINDIERAENFWRRSVEPKLIERQRRYGADKEYYREKYTKLSKKNEFVSFDFLGYVKWAESSMMQAFFGTDDILSIVGNEPEDVSRADKMNKLINYQLTQQNKGYLVFLSWFNDALALELGVIKCYWQREVDWTEETAVLPYDRIFELNSQPNIEVVSVGEPDFFGDAAVKYRVGTVRKNQPVIESVSAFDMRWSPEAKTLDTANFVAQRKIVSIDYLRRQANSGVYDKQKIEEVADNLSDVDFSMTDRMLNPDTVEDNFDEEEEGRQLVELYECYVKVDANDDGLLEDCIVTVVNDVVLRVEPNTFGRVPFFDLSPNRTPHKVYPDLGTAEIIGEIQDIKVAIIRQMIINLALTNNPRRFVNTASVEMNDINADRENIRVNGDVRAAIITEPPMNIASWTMPFFELLNGFVEEWTGKTRYNQGLDANSLNKTATGVSMIMKASTQRIGETIRRFAETGVGELNKFLIRLNQMYIDQKQVFRLTNETLEISPDDLGGSLDIVVNVNVGVGEKEQVIQTLYSYLSQLYPFAEGRGVATPDQFAAAAIRAMEESGLRNAGEYIKSPETIRNEQAQMQQMQQMMGGGGVG